jgi:hypothetical protein
LSQGELEGLRDGPEQEVAELELGGAEGALLVGDQAAGDVEEFLAEGLLQVGGQLLGAGFLLGSQRCRRHEALHGRGISGERRR